MKAIQFFAILCLSFTSQLIGQEVKDVQLPLGGNKASFYQAAFCYRPASASGKTPGHAFLAIGEWSKDAKEVKVHGYGFYPKDNSIFGSVLGPGVVKFPLSDETVVKSSKFLFERSPGPVALPANSCRVLKHISKEEFEKLQTKFNKWDKTYFVGGSSKVGDNCVTMMHEVAQVIGIKIPDSASFRLPENYIQELWKLNKPDEVVVPPLH